MIKGVLLDDDPDDGDEADLHVALPDRHRKLLPSYLEGSNRHQ
jgi:hypothetical protein